MTHMLYLASCLFTFAVVMFDRDEIFAGLIFFVGSCIFYAMAAYKESKK